jgi:hypothetical protein
MEGGGRGRVGVAVRSSYEGWVDSFPNGMKNGTSGLCDLFVVCDRTCRCS